MKVIRYITFRAALVLCASLVINAQFAIAFYSPKGIEAYYERVAANNKTRLPHGAGGEVKASIVAAANQAVTNTEDKEQRKQFELSKEKKEEGCPDSTRTMTEERRLRLQNQNKKESPSKILQKQEIHEQEKKVSRGKESGVEEIKENLQEVNKEVDGRPDDKKGETTETQIESSAPQRSAILLRRKVLYNLDKYRFQKYKRDEPKFVMYDEDTLPGRIADARRNAELRDSLYDDSTSPTRIGKEDVHGTSIERKANTITSMVYAAYEQEMDRYTQDDGNSNLFILGNLQNLNYFNSSNDNIETRPIYD